MKIGCKVDACGASGIDGRHVCIGGMITRLHPFDGSCAFVEGTWDNDWTVEDFGWYVDHRDLRPHIPRKQPKRDAKSGRFAKKEPWLPKIDSEAIKVLEQERDMHRHCEREQKKKADALDAAIKAMKGEKT